MDNEVYSFALKSALEEIRSICPGITHTLMFTEDGELIVIGDQNTPEKTIGQVVNAFDGIFEKSDSIGQVQYITLEGSNGRMNVFFMNDLHFLIATSKNADLDFVNTVTHVLIPAALRLAEKISSAPIKNSSSLAEIKADPRVPISEEDENPQPPTAITREKIEEPEENSAPKTEFEPIIPEAPTNQLIVENLGGLLVPSDTVRIDSAVLSQWKELYEGKKIEEVEIETFNGKKTTCKVKPIKDLKFDGKGNVQMPEKIQATLEIAKGELVRAKPIVE
jgi:hypothetical protein